MLITNREKEIIEKNLKEYNYLKSLFDKMEFKELAEVDEFLKRFKDADVYNLDKTEGYLDFYYKDLSLCVSKCDEVIKLCDCISVWDKDKDEYIFEYNSIGYIEEQLNMDKYDAVKEQLNRMKNVENAKMNISSYKTELVNYIQYMF